MCLNVFRHPRTSNMRYKNLKCLVHPKAEIKPSDYISLANRRYEAPWIRETCPRVKQDCRNLWPMILGWIRSMGRYEDRRATSAMRGRTLDAPGWRVLITAVYSAVACTGTAYLISHTPLRCKRDAMLVDGPGSKFRRKRFAIAAMGAGSGLLTI